MGRTVGGGEPVLATGKWAGAAGRRVRGERPTSIRVLCLVAAPEGVEARSANHPDVGIWAAAVD